ncbi:upf0739 protein c1orf74 homolog [Plakobranchus ocellatus]|uniref:Upf0739 protein c1orf74 homolog n=1 Tax=Plakobranchus ocellatus TaxID=259542 RepID=A0AAV4E300_9GAST|nr:upf0739 protein c1orf74 homolog [Plakobranchus ocellatus]
MDATTEQWKKITIATFGKRSKVHWRQAMMDILFVDLGLKPACLFDHWLADLKSMHSYLMSLYTECLVSKKLRVVAIGMDVIVYESCWLKSCFHAEFVDISSNLHQPSLITAKEKVAQTADVFKQWCSQCHNPASSLECDEIVTSDSVNIPTLFGLFLGYPCVYWYDQAMGEDNNLSSCSLRLFQVKGCVKPGALPHNEGHSCQKSSGVSKSSKFSYVLKENKTACSVVYSFTVPENIVESVREKVWLWYTAWEQSVPWSSLFSSVWMQEESVEPGAVCL